MAGASPVDRRARGFAVEALVRDHLMQAGLRYIASNATARGGEIDLVMLDTTGRAGPTLVFVEVRFRGHSGFGGGAVSVDAGKRRRLVHAAQAFLGAHREYRDAACRFDVVEASGDPAAPTLVWLRDAFRADDA